MVLKLILDRWDTIVICDIVDPILGLIFFLHFVQLILTRWRALKEPRVASREAVEESY